MIIAIFLFIVYIAYSSLFFFNGQAVYYVGSSFSDQGSNLSPLGVPWFVWW